ncbi:MAG: hypothetical protein INR62_04450 [Rhodospirillales bacterium]|nr:hypothetical protein [Acetobacter sp.]
MARAVVVNYTVWDLSSGGWTNYINVYEKGESYRQSSTVVATSTAPGLGGTSYEYGHVGELSRVVDIRNPEATRTFVNDIAGNMLYAEQGGHVQRQLVVNGEVLGRYGHLANFRAAFKRRFAISPLAVRKGRATGQHKAGGQIATDRRGELEAVSRLPGWRPAMDVHVDGLR